MKSSSNHGNTRWMGGKTLLAGAGLLLAGRAALRRAQRDDLHGEVALVTGGSRGLGFLIARELGRQGCRLAICARDLAELERAQIELQRDGAEVFIVECDVAGEQQVERMIEQVTRHYGRIDILVNNAGIIQVGPLQAMTHTDFEQAIDVMYWGAVNPTLAVLPQMRARGSGRICTITSIGGEVSVPRLLAYSGAKYAATGFSEGLYAELAPAGVHVTTVVPGLMRTGGHLNATFKGDLAREFTWMSLSSNLPGISMDAERAASQVVAAVRNRESFVVLSIPATLIDRFHGLFPGATQHLLMLANRYVLPKDDGTGREKVRGMDVEQRHPSRLRDRLTTLGRTAGKRFNAYPGTITREVPQQMNGESAP